MDIIYFIIWFVITSIGLLIFPIDNWIEKRNDDSRLKKWWKKHVISVDPNEKDSI